MDLRLHSEDWSNASLKEREKRASGEIAGKGLAKKRQRWTCGPTHRQDKATLCVGANRK